VTAHRLDDDPAAWPLLPPIGRPIANTRIHLLDRGGHPVPVGVPGDLHVGGVPLARGYLDRRELTASRFLPDPFGDEPGARVYLTGDRARWLADGTLEYLGRSDNQVKVRGFRVELGEVEAALVAHPAVRAAAVVVREERPDDKRLVAYVVPENLPGPSATEVRAFLQRTLPEYMLPSAFVTLHALPLSPNGKVDRRALPALDRGRGDDRTFVPPRDEVEQRLAEIWRRLLALEGPVGVTDDFFDLGGHSLLAVRLFAEIERAFGTHLPLALLFEGATIESLAIRLRPQPGPTPLRTAVVPIQHGEPSRPKLFLTPWISGEVLGYRELVAHLGKDQPVYALEAVGLDGRTRPIRSVEEMARYHVSELRKVQPEGPYLLGGYCFGGVVAFEMARQLHDQGQEVSLLALMDASPFGYDARTRWHKRVLWLKKHSRLVHPSPRVRAAYMRTRDRTFKEFMLQNLSAQAHRVYPQLGLPVPRVLRDLSVINHESLWRYVPRPYSGRVSLFRLVEGSPGDPRARASRWAPFAGGGLDIHEVFLEQWAADSLSLPGTGDESSGGPPAVRLGWMHRTLMHEPYVQQVAAWLRNAIDEALGAAASPGRRSGGGISSPGGLGQDR
jgi:acyl carrier protein